MPDGETPEPEPTSSETPEAGEGTEPEPDWKAEAERWKANSRKNEQRARENAQAKSELEELRRQSMTEQEQAVAKAKDEGIALGRAQGAARLVDAELRAAAKGRIADVDALLEGLDRSAFLGDDGEPNRENIAAWIDRIAPATEPEPPATTSTAPPGFPPVPDIGQGNRGQATDALNGDPILESMKQMLDLPKG